MFGGAGRQAGSSRRTAVSPVALCRARHASRKTELDIWELPYSVAPKRFEKTALTDEELERELARSPLHDALRQRSLSPLKAASAVTQQGPHQPPAHDRHAGWLRALGPAPCRTWLDLEGREASPHRAKRNAER